MTGKVSLDRPSGYAGPERRNLAVRNELSSEESAVFIYIKRFREQFPLDLEGERFSSYKVRDAVIALCENLQPRLTREQQAFRENLLSQVEAAGSVWTEHFPIEDGPSKAKLERVIRGFIQSLTPQVLDGFRTLCPDTARIVVVPSLPMPKLLNLLDTHKKMPDQENSNLIWEPWRGFQAEQWSVGLTDGAEKIPINLKLYWKDEGANEARTVEEMLDVYQGIFGDLGLSIMPAYGYVPSQARTLAGGKVLDQGECCTTFFGRLRGTPDLPYGRWEKAMNRLKLGGFNRYGLNVQFTCRPWFEREFQF